MKLSRIAGLLAAAAIVAASGAARAEVAVGSTLSGTASWYQCCKRTADGRPFNPDGLSMAHRSLPLGTRVLVRNLKNGVTKEAVVNDRGPHVKGRVFDCSRGLKRALGMGDIGHIQITVVSLNRQVGVRVASVRKGGAKSARRAGGARKTG